MSSENGQTGHLAVHPGLNFNDYDLAAHMQINGGMQNGIQNGLNGLNGMGMMQNGQKYERGELLGRVKNAFETRNQASIHLFSRIFAFGKKFVLRKFSLLREERSSLSMREMFFGEKSFFRFSNMISTFSLSSHTHLIIGAFS